MTEGDKAAAARGMFRAVGFTDADFQKPIVGIASGWSTITPCNYHLKDLADGANEGAREGGGVPQTFGTITVSDGMAMGHEGMKFSLLSREVIADSIEVVGNAQRFDAMISIGGCDKNMPGALMGLARLNLPSIFLSMADRFFRALSIIKTSMWCRFSKPWANSAAGKISRAEFECVGKSSLPKDLVPAAVCTPLTPCLVRWKPWACLCLVVLVFLRSVLAKKPKQELQQLR